MSLEFLIILCQGAQHSLVYGRGGRFSCAAAAGYLVQNGAPILGRKNPLMCEADRQILLDIIRRQGENLTKLDKVTTMPSCRSPAFGASSGLTLKIRCSRT